MPSMDQLIANLANSEYSTGPKTEKGKHRTRLNACLNPHGQICLLAAGEHEAFDQQALEEAQLLAQLAESNGEMYDLASSFPPELLQIGSEFSSAVISRLIARNQRLNEARVLVGQPIPAPIPAPIMAAAPFQAACSVPS